MILTISVVLYRTTDRFSPTELVTPEITHSSNPLHQLLQQRPMPPPPPQMQPISAQQQSFLQQFLSPANNMPMNSYLRPQPPVPPPASAAPPPAPLATNLQFFPQNNQFPPPRRGPSPPPYPSQFQPVPPAGFPSAPRSISVTSVDGSRSNGAGGSTVSSLSGSPRQSSQIGVNTVPPGTPLSDERVEYQSRGETDPSESRSLEVMPITLYNSERTSQLGNLISVNEHFISYPIRNGLIRVISQSSVDRLLLRKHEHHAVTELAFFNSKSDLLLSAGTDHHIAIWGIVNDPMSRELLKLVPTPAQRVKWHPTDSNKIAIANGSVVFVADLSNVNADGEGAENLYDISVVCGQTSGQINDVTFSPAGDAVVTAGSDGFVHIYRTHARQPGQPAEFVHRFDPFDGAVVNSVHFFNGNFLNQPGLLIGGEGNTRLSLWNAPLTENTQPISYQSVTIVGPSTASDSTVIHETLLDPTNQFLFVADRANPLVYAFHLASSENTRTPRRFDNVTEFALAYPVLSMGILNRSHGQSARAGEDGDALSADAALNFSMQLYCLQTQAIQRYYVAASDCYIPSSRQHAGSSIEDELPSVESSASAGQTVGAMTTEGESGEMSFQSAAESPRAAGAASSPETEIDVQTTPQDNEGSDNDEDAQRLSFRGSAAGSSRASAPSSPARSISRPLQLPIVNDDGASSLAGDDGALPSIPSYARSSPSSSIRAFQDEASLQYEPSIDDLASETQQQPLLAYLRRMEANQLQRDEQMREQMRTLMGNLGNHLTTQVSLQVEKSVQKQLQTVLVPAMGRIVLHTMEHNFMKPVQNGFQHVISEKLIPQMEQKLNESLMSALPEQMGNGVDEMVQRVVDDVRQPVRESFRECFQDIIIPSFQAATQKMFEQINDTFVKGTRSAFEGSGQSKSNAQVLNQLKELSSVVGDLSKQVETLSAAVAGASGSAAVATNGPSSSPEELQFEAQKTAVSEYLAHDDFEEAFKVALGAQNVKLVAYACQQCDARLVLCSRPPKLSQMIILCLVQQLGADLADDLQTKLNWLRESLLVMDVRDQTIAGFVTSVLQELQSALNSVPAESRDSQYTLLHHILNSMLSSA